MGKRERGSINLQLINVFIDMALCQFDPQLSTETLFSSRFFVTKVLNALAVKRTVVWTSARYIAVDIRATCKQKMDANTLDGHGSVVQVGHYLPGHFTW